MLEATILQHLQQLPESLQQEVLHYTQFLLAHQAQASSASPKRQAGFLQGTFTLPLPDDFDAPLDDLQDYMA